MTYKVLMGTLNPTHSLRSFSITAIRSVIFQSCVFHCPWMVDVFSKSLCTSLEQLSPWLITFCWLILSVFQEWRNLLSCMKFNIHRVRGKSVQQIQMPGYNFCEVAPQNYRTVTNVHSPNEW